MTNNTTYTECVACSGHLTGIADRVATCDKCGGVHGHEAVLVAVVNVDKPMLEDADPRGTRYFDVTIDETRIHGWFDVLSMRVVQYG